MFKRKKSRGSNSKCGCVECVSVEKIVELNLLLYLVLFFVCKYDLSFLSFFVGPKKSFPCFALLYIFLVPFSFSFVARHSISTLKGVEKKKNNWYTSSSLQQQSKSIAFPKKPYTTVLAT